MFTLKVKTTDMISGEVVRQAWDYETLDDARGDLEMVLGEQDTHESVWWKILDRGEGVETGYEPAPDFQA